jgi:hypothetical protein
MMGFSERFTEEERQELAAANAVRARIKAQRRNRQAVADEAARVREAQHKALEEAKAAARRAAKKDFDDRLRRVLLGLSRDLYENDLGLVGMFPKDSSHRVEVFTISDRKGAAGAEYNPYPQHDTLVYWVHGKGFEWE